MAEQKKITPEMDQVHEAHQKASGLNAKMAAAILGHSKRPSQGHLMKHHQRVNENLSLQKAAAESKDFD